MITGLHCNGLCVVPVLVNGRNRFQISFDLDVVDIGIEYPERFFPAVIYSFRNESEACDLMCKLNDIMNNDYVLDNKEWVYEHL